MPTKSLKPSASPSPSRATGQQPPRLVWPVAGPSRITSTFGDPRSYPRWPGLQRHEGVDIAPVDRKRPVNAVAAHSGVVERVGTDPDGYGNYVKLRDLQGRLLTLYGHLQSVNVRPGQRVNAGDPIGVVGSTGYSTGPHLHFSVQVPGQGVSGMVLPDVLDPLPLLSQPAANTTAQVLSKTAPQARAKRYAPASPERQLQTGPNPPRPPIGYWPIPMQQPDTVVSPAGMTRLQQEIGPGTVNVGKAITDAVDQAVSSNITSPINNAVNSAIESINDRLSEVAPRVAVGIALILIMVLSLYVFVAK